MPRRVERETCDPCLTRIVGDNIKTPFTIIHSGLSKEVKNDEPNIILVKEVKYRLTSAFYGVTKQ